MAYNLGIDIGERSIGFAAVDIENENILCANAHLFGVAIDRMGNVLNPKIRRPRRGQRRIISRRKVRLLRLCKMLGYTPEQRDEIFKRKETRVPVWALRAHAVDPKIKEHLSDEEFFRVVYHIARHRAFQSNSLKLKNEPDDGKINDARENFKKRIGLNQTPGHYLYEEALRNPNRNQQETETWDEYIKRVNPQKRELSRIRNTDDEYLNFMERDTLRSELRQIVKRQRELGQPKASLNICEWFEEEKNSFWQRPLKSSEELIGNCSVISTPELAKKCGLTKIPKRAPRHAPTAILFIFWSDLNNLRIRDDFGRLRMADGNLVEGLFQKERENIFELVLRPC